MEYDKSSIEVLTTVRQMPMEGEGEVIISVACRGPKLEER